MRKRSPSQFDAEMRMISVAAEEVTIGTSRIERGRVRIIKSLKTEETTRTEAAWKKEVSIERIPVDRFVDQPGGIR